MQSLEFSFGELAGQGGLSSSYDGHEIDFYSRLGYIPASSILFLERYFYG